MAWITLNALALPRDDRPNPPCFLLFYLENHVCSMLQTLMDNPFSYHLQPMTIGKFCETCWQILGKSLHTIPHKIVIWVCWDGDVCIPMKNNLMYFNINFGKI